MSQIRLQLLDKTIHYQQKREVVSLVARLRAEWVIFGVMARMLPETPGLERLRFYMPHSAQQTTALPSAELPGLKFVLRPRPMGERGAALTRKWLNEGQSGIQCTPDIN